MMDTVQHKLSEIITTYGRSVCDDPRRCEALLRDLCGDQRRAIHVLMGALNGRVAADLLSAAPGVPRTVLLAQLARRLEDDQALTVEAARWAVQTWALALGAITSADLAPGPQVPQASLPPRTQSNRFGGALAWRPLHLIWILDCSYSMRTDGKIQALNHAVREATQPMQQAAAENPNAEVLVRAITFSTGAQWHVAQPTPVESFRWTDMGAEGARDMGRALSMVAAQLRRPPMPDRALPPVLVLVTDGSPTDDFTAGLRDLMDQPWGRKAIRIGIAIGQDADLEVLQRFIGNPEIRPLTASNPEQFVNRIKWVSTAVVGAVAPPPEPATEQHFRPEQPSDPRRCD